MTNNNNNGKIKLYERVSNLETSLNNCQNYHGKQLTDLANEVKEIKNNHLVHINERLDSQKNWIVGVLVAIIMTLIGTLINLVI